MPRVANVDVPSLLYGTAWKEDDTHRLTRLALDAGFRGIDTANQRRHYHEVAVGQAVQDVLRIGAITRDELFLQTKFTHIDGQDHRLPYDAGAPVRVQVEQSATSSLEHFGVTKIDSYVLHGPSSRHGLEPEDLEAWSAMEALHDAGTVGLLGVSNVTAEQLTLLIETARIAPVFVQNRCYARTGWDRSVRDVCAHHGIVYQGFSLLTANQREMANPRIRKIAARLNATVAQVVFRFAIDVGMLPLTGTTDPKHMREDLAATELSLSKEDVDTIANIGV